MSGFQSLAPSNLQDDSSAASSLKLSTDSASGGTSGSRGDGSGSGGRNPKNRKRRTAGSVSLMACSPCRQARQRCDGQRPSECGRCAQRRLDCVYESHKKTHKDDLIREIEVLRGDNTSLQNRNIEMEEEAAETDTVNQNLREEGAWHRIILDTIGSNGHDQEIIKRLRADESHQAIAEWLVRENPDFGNLGLQPTPQSRLVDVVELFEGQCQEQDGLHLFGPSDSDSEVPWTQVITSQILIGHLFDLYFTWVHPVHMLFSEMDFKKDFSENQGIYCSVPLVNAICAMACNLLEDEHANERRKSIEAATLREGFMNEARRTLSPDSYRRMTTIQTFAIMYLVEMSSGKARIAAGYLRSAVENMKTNDGPEHSEEVNELTLWGLHTLNTMCGGITYLRLYAPSTTGEPIFEHVRRDKDDAQWRFYRHSGNARDLPTGPSHAIMTACHQAGLFRVVGESLDLYCGIRGSVSAFKILEIYRKYLNWKDTLPPILANYSEGDQPLPHILYLHVQYHTALVQLFRPLLHGQFFSGDDQAELRRIVLFHARSGIEPLSHAKRLYSSRYFLPLIMFCLVHLGDTIITYSPQDPPAPETVKFCLQTLQQARAGFALCGPLQLLFKQRAEECGVQMPEELRELTESFDHYAMDDILDACTRLTYAEPLDQIIRHVDPAIAKDWNGEWEAQVIGRKSSRTQSVGGNYLQIRSILNG